MAPLVQECPECGGPLFVLGVLGRVAHFRCRDCGIDTAVDDPGVAREVEAALNAGDADGPSEAEMEAYDLEHAPAWDDVVDGIVGGLVLDPERYA